MGDPAKTWCVGLAIILSSLTMSEVTSCTYGVLFAVLPTTGEKAILELRVPTPRFEGFANIGDVRSSVLSDSPWCSFL
jgi:hypothetical protein